MIVKRFYDEKLAQTSYLIGCGARGAAIVIDPNRDSAHYIRAAAAENVKITHVTETHIHADFVSGTRELAAATGATMCLSAEGGPDWQYAFAKAGGAKLLRDGDTMKVGNIVITAIHTPGHTPEHLTFLVTDTAAADEPIAAVTGDFVFVGDVGRPDLLEKAAGIAGTMDAAARTLFASLQKFKREQPDWLQIWPGHGAGSACGKGLSAVPHSTVGYERRFNWAFDIDDEETFVRAVLEGQPEPPKYFAQMKRINRQGPPVLGKFREPGQLPAEELGKTLDAGALVIDTRPAPVFARGHVPGTINIPLGKSFNTWAGWLVPYDRNFYLIADDAHAAEATRDLAMIGLDRVVGYFPSFAVAMWASGGRKLDTVAQEDSSRLVGRMKTGAVNVIDVRARSEWDAGHIPGVPNIPLGRLPERLAEIPADRPVVLQCQTGARSAIAASLLQARGVKDVVNLTGGFVGWEAAGNPVERETLAGSVA
ncbi:MAG: MBL fold metallo-hydrolase [Gemmatimonadaceae bacterium]|nr:MBL fold metallo-hydrolase [Gemmatimonadaceae bacterium]